MTESGEGGSPGNAPRDGEPLTGSSAPAIMSPATPEVATPEAAPAPREIELKLECRLSDLPVLAAHPLLGGTKRRPVRLVSTYFDTPDSDLRKAGLSLRVRRSGKSYLQTVKAGEGQAGLFDRSEWERRIMQPEPDPAAWADTPVPELLARLEAPRLVPMLTTVVSRRKMPVSQGGAQILATLDDGRVQTGAGEARLCELELELVSGEPAELFALAKGLSADVPLRLGVVSKSERGVRLLQGSDQGPSKAPPLALSPEASAADAFRAIARTCLRHLRLNEDVFLASRDPEALHQIRVSLRRLRSAFSLFDPILGHDPAARGFADTIKAMTEPFGKARNLDVFLAETLPAERERRPGEPGFEALSTTLGSDRDAAHDTVCAVLDSQAWRGLLLELVAWLETGPWLGEGGPPERDGSARDFAAATLDRFRRRVKKRGRDLAGLDPEARHRVRIAAKKLRYGADFFASLFPDKTARKRHRAFSETLSELQDHLGALNDMATAHSVLAPLADDSRLTGKAVFAAGLIAGDKEAGGAELIEAAAEVYEALIDLKRFWA